MIRLQLSLGVSPHPTYLVTAADPTSTCPECGAPLAAGRTCVDYFHDLLALEAGVLGAPGAEPHFFAVAAYNLQHPSSFTPAALVGLQRTVADVLLGRATLADARQRARAAADGAMRVRRRAGTKETAADQAMLRAWPTVWGVTVRDVLAGGADCYGERVSTWARAVAAALDAVVASPAKSAG
jgi:hypothetical protein